MNGEEPVNSAPVGEQPEVVSLGPPSGVEVVDAVEGAMGALNRNEEFSKIAGSDESKAGGDLGLPDSLNPPASEVTGVADTSTPIEDLLPALTTTTTSPTEATTPPTTTLPTTTSPPPTLPASESIPPRTL